MARRPLLLFQPLTAPPNRWTPRAEWPVDADAEGRRHVVQRLPDGVRAAQPDPLTKLVIEY